MNPTTPTAVPSFQVEVRFRRLSAWPPVPRPGDRQLSKKWASAQDGIVNEIKAELGAMGVREFLVETDHRGEDYSRLDGRPRGDAAPATNRIAVWFEVGGQMRVIRCEAHGSWTKNLKAVAMTLNRNRLLRSYGTMTVEEQYGGFTALPPGNGASDPGAPFGTLEDAARFILECAGRPTGSGQAVRQVIGDPAQRRQMYRNAAEKVHPDRNGGKAEKMTRLNAAKSMLEDHATTLAGGGA